jgi:hypothetical protein
VNPKSLFLLLALTGLTALVATFAIRGRSAAVAGADAGEVLFPALMDKINDVARIEISDGDEVCSIEKTDGNWGLAEKNGYPVDFERVKKTLVTVAELGIIEKKTADPARHASLHLEEPHSHSDGDGHEHEPAVEAPTTKVLTLKGSGGDELAALVIGKVRPNRSGLSSFYARRVGEDQTWLVEGAMTLDAQGANWLDKQILKIEKDRIRSIRVLHADGEELVVTKAQPGDAFLQVAGIPEGRELKYPTVANGMASGLEWCNLDDVFPLESAIELGLPEDPVATCTFKAFDGLVVTVRVWDHEGTSYARFQAAFVPEEIHQYEEGDEFEPLKLPEVPDPA